MARRNKRASMREGPLADLFRSTGADSPADPPEAPRYGRDDPAEARKAEADSVDPSSSGAFFDQDQNPDPAAAPQPPAGEESVARREPQPEPPREPVAREPEPPVHEPEPRLEDPPQSSEPAPERLKRVLAAIARGLPPDPALWPRGARLRAARLG